MLACQEVPVLQNAFVRPGHRCLVAVCRAVGLNRGVLHGAKSRGVESLQRGSNSSTVAVRGDRQSHLRLRPGLTPAASAI